MELVIKIWDPDDGVYVTGSDELGVNELLNSYVVNNYNTQDSNYPGCLVVWMIVRKIVGVVNTCPECGDLDVLKSPCSICGRVR